MGMTSFYDFIIQPTIDDRQVRQDASKFADRISRTLGKEGIQIPVNINRKDLQQVMEYVTKLGGEVNRVGTKITASFTGQNGKRVSVRGSFDKSLNSQEEYIRNAPSSSIRENDRQRILREINDFRQTSEKFTPNDQVKQQVQTQNELIKSLQTQYDIKLKIAKLDEQDNNILSEYYSKQLSNEQSLYQSKLSDYKDSGYPTQKIEAIQKELSLQFDNESTAIKNKIIDDKNLKESIILINQFKKRTQEVQSLLSSGNLSQEFEQTEKVLDDVVSQLKEFGIFVTNGQLSFDETSNGAIQSAQNISRLQDEIQETNTAISILDAKTNDAFNAQDEKQYQQTIDDITNTIEKYVEIFKRKQLLEELGTTTNSNLSQEYKNLDDRLEDVAEELKQYGILVENNTDGTVRLVSANDSLASSNKDVAEAINNSNIELGIQEKQSRNVVTDFIKYRIVLQGVEQVVQSFTSAIKDMNDAMTQVRMVNMDSREDTKQLAQEYTNLAKELGQTTTKVAEGADAWLRQGYNSEQSLELLKASTTLATVGQLEAAQATENLTSVMNAYGVEVSEVMGVVDQLTNLDLHYAASSGGIATALQKVSSSAKQAGVSLEKLMSIITVTTQITQQAPEVIGTSWQSVFTRMTKIVAGVDLDDLTDEITGQTYAVNEADEVLHRYGISLVDEAGNMRDLGIVLDEIGAKWQGMSKLEQNQLSYVIAGTRQRNAFIAAMDNYNMVLEAEKIALDSSGTATEKMTIYNESLEASQNRLTAAIQEFASNSDLDQLFIHGIDFLTNIISLLDIILNKIPVLSGLIKTLLIAQGLTLLINSFESLNNVSGKFFKQISGGGFSKLLNTKDAVTSLLGVKTALSQSSQAALTATVSFAGLSAPLWGLVAIVTAFSAILGGISWLDYINSAEYSKNKTQELQDSFKSTSKEIEDLSNKLESNNAIILELNKIETPTLTDTTQLKLLKQENDELEKQLQHKKALAQESAKEQVSNAQKWIRNTQKNPVRNWSELSDSEKQSYADSHGYYTGSSYAAIGKTYDMSKAEAAYNQVISESSNKQIEERKNALQANIDAFNNKVNTGIALSDEEIQLYNEYTSEMVDKLVSQGMNQQAIDYIFNQQNFDNSITQGKRSVTNLNENLSSGIIDKETYLNELHDVAVAIAQDEEVKIALQKALELSPEDYNANFDQVVDFILTKFDTLGNEIEQKQINFPDFWKDWNSQIDQIQSSFDSLNNAILEYNTYGGLSADTLQTLMALEDDYINAISIENGVMTLNADAISVATQNRYDEAKAMVYEQALQEIQALNDEQEVENASNSANALIGKAEVLAELTGQYGNLAEAAAQAAIVQALADGAGTNELTEKQNKIAEAAAKKIGLLDQAAKNAGHSFKGLSNHLGGYQKQAQKAKDTTQELLNSMKDAKDSIGNLIDMTMDMLKQQYEDEKESLDEQLDDFEKKINAQKEYLDLQKKELDHQKEIEKKNNNIANIQEQLAELEFDNSAEGQAKKLQLLEQLNQAQTDLTDYQNEYDTNSRQDALDKELDSFTNMIDEQKNYIDKVLLDEYNLYKKAIELIEGRSVEFYNQLINWNKVYGSHIDQDVINAWNLAYEAMDRYGGLGTGVQGIMEGLTREINALERATKNAADQADRYYQSMSRVSRVPPPAPPPTPRPPTKTEMKDNYISESGKKPSINQGAGGSLGLGRPGMNNTIERYHTGTKYVRKSDSWLDRMLGLGVNETAAILKVGEAVIPKYANISPSSFSPSMPKSNGYIKAKYASSNAMSIDMGDISVSGIDIDQIKKEIEKAKEDFVQTIYKIANRHSNFSGVKNQRLLV